MLGPFSSFFKIFFNLVFSVSSFDPPLHLHGPVGVWWGPLQTPACQPGDRDDDDGGGGGDGDGGGGGDGYGGGGIV